MRKQRFTLRKERRKQEEDTKVLPKKQTLSESFYWAEQSARVASLQHQVQGHVKGDDSTAQLLVQLDSIDDKSLVVQKRGRDNSALLQAITAYTQTHHLSILDLFNLGDEDSNGELDRQEFKNLIVSLNKSLCFSETDIRAVTVQLFRGEPAGANAMYMYAHACTSLLYLLHKESELQKLSLSFCHCHCYCILILDYIRTSQMVTHRAGDAKPCDI
jgi:hypothetical protein